MLYERIITWHIPLIGGSISLILRLVTLVLIDRIWIIDLLVPLVANERLVTDIRVGTILIIHSDINLL